MSGLQRELQIIEIGRLGRDRTNRGTGRYDFSHSNRFYSLELSVEDFL